MESITDVNLNTCLPICVFFGLSQEISWTYFYETFPRLIYRGENIFSVIKLPSDKIATFENLIITA